MAVMLDTTAHITACAVRHSSSVVEHSIRNRAVIGSIPICGS